MLIDAFCGRYKGDLLVPNFSFRRAEYESIPPQLLTEICALRYEVYCLECHFLDPDQYAKGLECDEYEHRSTHVAAYNLANNIVGTVRLVHATDQEQTFPWESHCQPFDHVTLPDYRQSAEVSRLVVHKQYRRRGGDSLEGISKEFATEPDPAIIKASAHIANKRRRNSTPQILLGMYRELYRYSRANGIRYWYAAMEKHLANSLRKMGFPFKPIGPEVDYYGPVTPYMADLDEVVASLRVSNPLLCAWFNDEPISRWMLIRTLVHYGYASLRKHH